jgi:site-specific DNA-methyltransferase (cytosine-N4-specific)
VSFAILEGDVLSRLSDLEPDSIDCVVTSPPYWGLRDYGVCGQIGAEPTPEDFIRKLQSVFSAIRRVLKPQGTLWINLGDTYCSGGRIGNGTREGYLQQSNRGANDFHSPSRPPQPRNLKPKDLIGIPWRVALALQADGWYLRSDIIWAKPNPMPESVTDRPTKSHEYVFLFSRSERYFYDADAVAEPQVDQERTRRLRESTAGLDRHALAGKGTRNRRSVWTIPSQPTPEAHFATFPIELPELCIMAGSPIGGVVMDPFCGSGTTGLACLRNGRSFVGIEINPQYVRLAQERARKVYPLLATVPEGVLEK